MNDVFLVLRVIVNFKKRVFFKMENFLVIWGGFFLEFGCFVLLYKVFDFIFLGY